MPMATHTKAAEDHKTAAQAHQTAADLHGKGDHSAALEKSTKAKSLRNPVHCGHRLRSKADTGMVIADSR